MTTPSTDIPAVHLVVLSRLLPPGEKGETITKVRNDLEPLLGERLAGGALAELLDATLDRLVEAGLVDRARKGKSERFALTDSGRRRALEALGLETLPPKTTWSQLRKKYLTALALGLPSPSGTKAKSFGTDTGFKAAALVARLDLAVDPYPGIKDATDALLWKLLGRTSSDPFNVTAVKEFLLAQALGTPDRPVKEKAAVELLLARDLRARNSKPAELREAALRRWLEPSTAPVDTTPATAPSISPTTTTPTQVHASAVGDDGRALPLPLDDFARRVLTAARARRVGRFGDDKVFIAHVWDALRGEPGFEGMDLDGFKRRLAEANQARHLNLSRADLVEAMDPEDVGASETAYLGARFHFIQI